MVKWESSGSFRALPLSEKDIVSSTSFCDKIQAVGLHICLHLGKKKFKIYLYFSLNMLGVIGCIYLSLNERMMLILKSSSKSKAPPMWV